MKADAWFVAWVATGREDELLAKIKALPKVTQALCPKARLWIRRSGEWKQEVQLLFPGYIFLRCRMDSEIYYALRDLPGVMGWLGKDTLWPSTVGQEEIERVLLLCGGGDPREALEAVTINKRQRRGYGTLRLKGADYKIPFALDNQATEPTGDASPEDDGADQDA